MTSLHALPARHRLLSPVARVLHALVLLLALFTSGCIDTSRSADRPLVIVEHDWDAALVLEHLIALVLEQRLGLETDFVPTELSVAFAAMDRADGSIDIAPDMWLPNQRDKWERFVAPGSRESVLVNARPYAGEQGFYVPGYVQDEHGVRSVDDLASAEVAALFDSDGDGRGEYWVGPAGWNSVAINQLKARSYGFDEFFEPLVVGEAVFKSKLEADIREERGALFYYWKPEWIHAAYDLRLLEEPAFDGYAQESMAEHPRYNPDGCWRPVLPEEDPNWLENGEVRCAYPDATIHVAYAKALTETHPRVARFLDQIYFDAAEIDRWVLLRAKEGVRARDIARSWIEENPEVVDEWLDGVETEARAGA